jgi:hypothetical protein
MPESGIKKNSFKFILFLQLRDIYQRQSWKYP